MEGSVLQQGGSPQEEGTPTTNELLTELVQNQRAQREELQQLRDEVAKTKAPPPAPTSQVRSQEELLAERMQEIEAYPFYCPGCGKLFKYPRECQGTGTAPHSPIEVVSTDELKSGDTAQHTVAPSTET